MNIFCDKNDLINEADVEALFVDRLLSYFKYPDDKIKRKKSLDEFVIGKGSKKEKYKPDYVLLDSANEPIIVIDAKSPNEGIEKYHYQVSSYALQLNQKFKDRNPVLYTVLTNGNIFSVYPWDSNQPVFYLTFDDFNPNNENYLELKANLSYSAFKQVKATRGVFEFNRPVISKLLKVFEECHNLIWKKEKIAPTDAFYEFSKIMFIKIREDSKIHQIIGSGKKPTKEDFVFSIDWIDSQSKVENHPFSSILFRQVQDDLEYQIKKNKKKRIFEKGEQLELKASTVYEVVKKLQHYDLYGIDEDLNGRMFETFLNATVRGKDLGQFFTPRGVVHYMVETANLHIKTDKNLPIDLKIPYVLDGCCGSGGFLIDAMADMIRSVRNTNILTNVEQDELINQMTDYHLYGIEANPKIARIARLNMYLHGDGGSKIFKADTLDKTLKIEAGMNEEEIEGLKELHDIFTNKRLRFHYILSNPPFSMKYEAKDKNEKEILQQYTKLAINIDGSLSGGEKSNVLFLERYYDLLKDDGGELLTVIDDTVLNGEQSQKYRDFIFDNFVLIQVVSLPFNCFFGADANVKTSIIHLRKKRKKEIQGNVFMAIANNVGHDDHSKPTPERNNLPMIAKYFDEWVKNQNFKSEIVQNQSSDEPLGCPMQIFQVAANKLSNKRIDAFYYAPELVEARNQLQQLQKQGVIELKKGADFSNIPIIKKKDEINFFGKVFKYFEIGDVTTDGTITKYIQDYFEYIPTRGRLKVQTGDIIFAKNNSSRGTTVIIPEEFDGCLVTTGFIGVRPKDENESLLLWSIMESEFFRQQIYYLSITASQPEVRENIFKEEVLIPYPISESDRENIIENARIAQSARKQLMHSVKNSSILINELFAGKKSVNAGVKDEELVARYESGEFNLGKALKPMLKTPSKSAILRKKKR